MGLALTQESMELQAGAGVAATMFGLAVIEGIGATRLTGPRLCPVAFATAGLAAGGASPNPDAIAAAATVFPCALFGAMVAESVESLRVTVVFGQNPYVP